MKSTPQELSNDRSHNGKSWLQQKLDIVVWKKTVWNGNISGTKNEKKLEKKFFLNVHLIRNLLVCIEKTNSKKEFLVIFMRKWVDIFLGEKGKYDKTIYEKSKAFHSYNIYIWNLLVKSFPVIGCMLAKVDDKLKLVILILWIKTSKTGISSDANMEKPGKNAIFDVR